MVIVPNQFFYDCTVIIGLREKSDGQHQLYFPLVLGLGLPCPIGEKKEKRDKI
ncbi:MULTISPECIES: hypothetical protein [unclassified Synechocystis]|uniref:hypothetical protein n=1 Tax=unclassified Synechocystis TaxID=2640012 RepID=UPI0003173EC4|nr:MULTISPECIES: hypothetical protein [unclassified Synechocystis]MBD2618779.1 hypothetical protein [Synechocystis sp. FACHB-898]MBD2640238.1 hypothetical protein [Synechocystis sp. FACHB-908]MBD2661360.1 hypothetical protein [Synechocystis sp. FACHB-929]NHL99204.1 hypothetical protein [Synechocystis sp. PCC 6803]QWO82058.1 hypothetical protein KBZ93_08165 [Synechocystis sp. PCC 6803]